MAGLNWAGRDERRRDSGMGGGTKMLLLAAAAAAWANRDKIMEQINKLRATVAEKAEQAADKASEKAADKGYTTGAHRADGSDDSASFGANIADEGTIPNKGSAF